MKYIINDIPPSNNKFIGRTNRWEYQRIKKEWAEKIYCASLPKPKTPILFADVTITYFFPNLKRRDPDNYSGKMILDGLTKAGVIYDDSFTHINLHLRSDIDRVNPRTEIEIFENFY